MCRAITAKTIFGFTCTFIFTGIINCGIYGASNRTAPPDASNIRQSLTPKVRLFTMEANATVSIRVPHGKNPHVKQEALTRAVSGKSLSNFPAIFQGFAAKGIPESEIKPRENVFTFDAWKALGRVVRRGERGVKVVTFIDGRSKEIDTDTGERKTIRRPWATTGFPVSQTEPLTGEGL